MIHGCRLFYRYEKSNSSDAPTLLLLHGWGCDGSIFSAFEDEWLKHASLLVVDFPGHGQSSEPPAPWGVPEYAAQIDTLLKQLSIEKVDIVAHSFGGRIAIYLASHHPEKIGKMVFTGAAGIREPVSQNKTKRQKQYQFFKSVLTALGKLSFMKALVEKWMDRLRQHYGSADYKLLKTDTMRKTFVKVITQDLSEMLSQIKAPTLLIWGSLDTATPLWMGQKMEKEIPDAGLIVFEGRTHFAFLEEARRFQMITGTFFWGGETV